MNKIKVIILIGICIFVWFSNDHLRSFKKNYIKTPVNSKTLGNSPGIDSPAIVMNDFVFISGQGAGSIKNSKNSEMQIEEAFKKLSNVARAAGGDLNDIVKITVYLTDLSDYASLNKIMKQYFKQPYPARSTVGVSMLPNDHRIEVDAIMFVKS